MESRFPPTPPPLPADYFTEAEGRAMEAGEQAFQAEQDWLDNIEKQKHQAQQRARKTEPRMLRTKDAAEYLGISEWKLRQMVYTGEIEVIRQKYWLFSIDDLDRWIKTNRERSDL